MSELVMPRSKGLVVSNVAPGSPADRAGVLVGDVLRRANGVEINDLVDLRYYGSEEQFQLELVRDGMYLTIDVEREWGEELGCEFTFELADQIHTCDNKCVFCFIHQMPKGMRKSLYLMDDDYRLSFLHGNYVTLTNMSEEEFTRTKEQGLSPLYVSVHATDDRLRGFMLGHPGAAPILPRIRDLNASGIRIHAQIVLCPGLNDGYALDNTISDLAELHPGVESIAVVPVGLSKFRHNLYPIRAVTPDYAKKFLKQMREWHRRLIPRLGTRFVFPSDEWFFYAKVPVPSRKWYENFPQFEDGVGTCRLFLEEARRGYSNLPKRIGREVHVTLLTGMLPSRVIAEFANRLNHVEGLIVDVCPVLNDFFGHGITVAGLMTGVDILKALDARPRAGIVALPDIALKDGHVLLDDLTLTDLRERSGRDIRACPSRAKEFLRDWLPSLTGYRN